MKKIVFAALIAVLSLAPAADAGVLGLFNRRANVVVVNNQPAVAAVQVRAVRANRNAVQVKVNNNAAAVRVRVR